MSIIIILLLYVEMVCYASYLTGDVLLIIIMHVYDILIIIILQVGWTALSMASCSGHEDIVETLLQAGAKPDVQDQVVECVKCVAVYVAVCISVCKVCGGVYFSQCLYVLA